MLATGLDKLIRGSVSISLGQISVGQTNPEEPDYFPPFPPGKSKKETIRNGMVVSEIPTKTYPYPNVSLQV